MFYSSGALKQTVVKIRHEVVVLDRARHLSGDLHIGLRV